MGKELSFEIEAHAKPAVRMALTDLGVNLQTLYPDLDGIAQSHGLWFFERHLWGYTP